MMLQHLYTKEERDMSRYKEYTRHKKFTSYMHKVNSRYVDLVAMQTDDGHMTHIHLPSNNMRAIIEHAIHCIQDITSHDVVSSHISCALFQENTPLRRHKQRSIRTLHKSDTI